MTNRGNIYPLDVPQQYVFHISVVLRKCLYLWSPKHPGVLLKLSIQGMVIK